MTVIPGSAVLNGEKVIDIIFQWSDVALGNTVDAVHFRSTELSYTMPVNSGSIVTKKISDIDHNLIPPARLNPGTRILSIEHFALGVCDTVRSYLHRGNIEVVDASDADWSIGFVVFIDIVVISSVRKPAATIARRVTWLPLAFHIGIIAGKVRSLG